MLFAVNKGKSILEKQAVEGLRGWKAVAAWKPTMDTDYMKFKSYYGYGAAWGARLKLILARVTTEILAIYSELVVDK